MDFLHRREYLLVQENKFKKNHLKYPICDIKFNELNVLDLTLFTMIGYENPAVHETILNKWFSSVFSTWGEYWYNVVGNESHPTTFFHIANDVFKYDIISIRGTSDQTDTKEDLKMFTEVASLQFISFFVPLTTILPE
eukprot:544146_1